MRTLSAALALLAAACGDEDESGKLTCAWLLDEGNCWRQTVRAAERCLPAEDEVGTFSPDRSSCSYEDGVRVSFARPFTDRTVGHGELVWDFTVERDGATCVDFVEHGDAGITLTTPGGTLRVEKLLAGMAVVCPDGSRYAGGTELLECAFDTLPGTARYTTSGSAAFSAVGLGDGSGVLGDGGLQIFDCEDASLQAP